MLKAIGIQVAVIRGWINQRTIGKLNNLDIKPFCFGDRCKRLGDLCMRPGRHAKTDFFR